MNLEKLRKSRYFYVAIAVVFLSGTIVVFMGGRINEEAIELGSLLVNVGSEIVVVAIIFLLGRILLLDSEEEILEGLKQIDSKIEPGKIEQIQQRSEVANPIT